MLRKMVRKVVLLFFTFFICASFSDKLPSEYQTCKGDDPNFKECLKQAVKDALNKLENGILNLDVPPLQPLNVPSITISEGKGPVNVVQKYKNFNIYDVGKANIEKFNTKLTPETFTLDLELYFAEVRFEADYSLDGFVLLLPIVGEGRCTVKLQKLTAIASLHAETIQENGTKYLKVKDLSLRLEPGKVVYNFENLFNGDEILSNQINIMLNENWKDIFDDIKNQYESVLQMVFTDFSNKIFSKVPYDDLF